MADQKKEEKVELLTDSSAKKSPTTTTSSITPATNTSSSTTTSLTKDTEKSPVPDKKEATSAEPKEKEKEKHKEKEKEKEKDKEKEKHKVNEKDMEKQSEKENEKEKEKHKEKEKEADKEKESKKDKNKEKDNNKEESKDKDKEKDKKEKDKEKTKETNDTKKPKETTPLGDKNGPTTGDKVQVTNEIKPDKDTDNEPGKPKEDTVSTATTKVAEEKSTEETPLKGEPVSKFKGVNGRLVFAVCACAFGSAFQHGYNLGVINAPLKLMEEWMNSTSYDRNGEYITKTQQTMITSWIVSIYCIGGMIGGGMTGFFSERYGRKGGLLINNVFAVAASIFFGFCKMANSWEMVIVGRFLIGINNGLNAGLAPMYLSEIAPTNLRGAIGTVYQLVVTISILFSQIMGLDSLLGTESLWPLLLALTVLPAIFQLCTLPICPESAKFLLINKEQRIEAQRALTWLRDTSNVHEELEEIQNEAEAQKLVPKISLREILTNPALRIPLVIAVMMMMAQQLSGINAAIFFSVKIYEQAGLNEAESLYATIAMGTMNVLMTFVSLILVERAGRKTLMLTGLSGMMIDTILLTICLVLQSESAKWLSYTSIVLVILFVVMFATGPGSIPWFLVNELFASNARPIASSIAVFVNWSAAFIVGLGFLPIQEVLGPYVFLVFSVILALFILFTIKKVPETKGRSIDEITALFKQQAYGGGINRV